jgi:RNA polymerase sigma-70 factor (ECF subfamily)
VDEDFAAAISSWVDALPGELRAQAERERASAETWLIEAEVLARTTLPSLRLSRLELYRYLATRTRADLPLSAALTELRVADLCLAAAAADGEPEAIAEIHRRHWPALRVALSRMSLSAAAVDDVLATLDERLFAGEPRRIAAFSGHGDLAGWLVVSATRVALSALRRTRHEIADEEPSGVGALSDDHELAFVKATHREDFRQAFGAAWKGLGSQERNLLRFHYLEGLSTERVGMAYGVHRATAVRWLAKARRALMKATRHHLTERLSLGREELDSLLRLVRSRLDESLARVLGEP